MQEVMRFFPFRTVRKVQNECMGLVHSAITEKKHLIMHAPTGLGKTAAILVPAISYALEKGKTVFFLTSRNTQHQLALETVRLIKNKRDLLATDIIGKQWMCSVENVERLYSSEFSEFCKKMREEHKCEHYERTRKQSGGLTVEAKLMLEQLTRENPLHAEAFVAKCRNAGLCPYEISTRLASKSQVIIADYHHVFHPHIGSQFLIKVKKELDDCIIIVDEAHNLPQRIRDTLTIRISSNTIKQSVREARKNNTHEVIEKLVRIQDVLNQLAQELHIGEEKLVQRNTFIEGLSKHFAYEEVLSELVSAGDEIRGAQQMSYVGRLADFLEAWKGEEEGFARILKMDEFKGKPNIVLSYRCLDPSVASREVIEQSHATVLMSGTLTPTFMYKDLLGFPESTQEASFESPFPQENKLALIVPKTTTKFSKRNSGQYSEIGRVCSEIMNAVPGNVAVFFPSYHLRDTIALHLETKKPVFMEQVRATKAERKDLLQRFKENKKKGAVLLGISAGSFGEGIDLPGELLRGVVVVGIPFKIPDLETKELINYYDRKFGKGWDYGYILPAITRILQNAGRCIRSESDRGVVVFLDERYALPKYNKCFPSEWDVKVCIDYEAKIKGFFELRL